ncbi:13214_t:CDS:1 [Ambispora gerdemannii]|uniref:13214_t:CDS:1 n=1 Tax=Ambispora gerdemannii TaxID=144530 RepID=A0A9N9G539_9GLOM|nr:13214_t:CDS:1 [Ambispora gerdemannii]
MEKRLKGNNAIKKGDYKTARDEYTKGLLETPKDPALWCNRSLAFLKEGYPELALVDALRAIVLLEKKMSEVITMLAGDETKSSGKEEFKIVSFSKDSWGTENLVEIGKEKLSCTSSQNKNCKDSHEKENDSANMEKIVQMLFKAFYRQAVAYSKLEIWYRAIESCNNFLTMQKNIEKYSISISNIDCLQLRSHCEKKHAEFTKKNPECVNFYHGVMKYKNGYPWDRSQENRDSEELFENLKIQIETLSDMKISLTRVEFGKSSNSTTSSPKKIQYGIEALQAISAECIIMEETAFLNVHNRFVSRCDYCNLPLADPKDNTMVFYECPETGCKEVYCDIECWQLASNEFHKPLCGKDITPILEITQNERSTGSLNFLFFLKIFAIAKIRGISPLDIDELKHLVRYRPIHGKLIYQHIWTSMYTYTLGILEISPFDVRFDFWMYLECIHMTRCNVFAATDDQGRPDCASCYSLMSLVNHDCSPNAFIIDHELTAAREIEKGEPVTISYIDDGDGDDDGDRQSQFANVFGFTCTCDRCQQLHVDEKNIK